MRPRFLLAALACLPLALRAQDARPAARVAAPRAGDAAPAAPPAAVARATATTAQARRAPVAPVLDGRDDDAAWRDAPVIDRFLEYEPNTGAETRFRTEVRVAYDDRYLYVLARMHDPAPDSIVSLLSRRDVRTASEQLKVVIDSYHDRRTAYQFAVNPAGVKRDYYVYNDATEDVTWDAVWDAATAVDSLGWVAELRIPFSQLRFPDAPEHTFGLLVVRDVQRTGARVSWPLYRRDRQGYVSQAGALSGIAGLPRPRRLELAPYAVTRNVTRAPAAPAGRYAHPQEHAVGADLKYGLTSNLTLDATVNPDFGQVEADPSVLNLSAFEQFFEERRPFFLEGAGIFSFRTDCADIDTGCRGLFYSRRIGRAPQLRDQYGDAASPQATTIAGAAKLTGRTARGLSLGVLDAVSRRGIGTEGRTIEPASNYFVARVQQDLADGQSGVGAMLTSVHRDLDAWTAPLLRRAAYTGGLDARHRFGRRNYELFASVAGSVVQGDTGAIRRLQTDGVHRFQRPDDALAVDPTRRALAGTAQRVSLSKFGGGVTRFQSVYQRYTPGFESNDLGFQRRADDQLFRNWFSLQLQKPTRYYRRAFLNFNASGNWTAAGLPTNVSANYNWHVELPSFYWLHVGTTAWGWAPTYDDRVARGGPAVRRSRGHNAWAGVETDGRRPVTASLFAGRVRDDEGATRGWSLDPSLQLRASTRFSGSLGFHYGRDRIGAQWLRNEGTAGSDTTRYLFARLDQTTFRTSARVNVTATPTLSLQLWAQPFVTTGRYAELRRLGDARAPRLADRFEPAAGDPGGFDFRELRSNTVLRWEYRPGSALFVVWQHGRSLYEDVPRDFALGRGLGDLLALPPNNTFLVKLSYWLNP
jgi:hypothetical protein